MRAIALAALMALPFAASGQEEKLQPTKLELVRCLSHVERASQKALLNQPTAEDLQQLGRCKNLDLDGLTSDQIRQFNAVLSMLLVQIEAPSATAHMMIISESQKLVRSLQ